MLLKKDKNLRFNLVFDKNDKKFFIFSIFFLELFLFLLIFLPAIFLPKKIVLFGGKIMGIGLHFV